VKLMATARAMPSGRARRRLRSGALSLVYGGLLLACGGLMWLGLHRVPMQAHVWRVARVQAAVEPLPGLLFDADSFRALRAAGPPAAVRWQPLQLPVRRPGAVEIELDGRRFIERLWLDVELPPALRASREPLALYVPRVYAGPYQLWLQQGGHSRLLADNLGQWRMQWNRPLHEPLPWTPAAGAAASRLLLAVPYDPERGYALTPIYVGEAAGVSGMVAVRTFFQSTLPQASSLVVLVMGWVSLQFWLARRQETPHLWLALSSLAWCVCNLQYVVDAPQAALAAAWYGWLVDASVSWMMLLVFLFAFSLHERRHRTIGRVLLGFAGGVSLLTLPLWSWDVEGNLLQQGVNTGVAAVVTLLISWRAWRGRRAEMMVLAAALWLAIAFGAHDVAMLGSRTDPESIYLLPFGTLLLFAAFMFAVQRRYIGAIGRVETVNDNLGRLLDQRQAELEMRHTELLEMERRQSLLLERQRLMRDMHDGLGSTLMSSLALVEQGELTSTQVGDALRECIDDLRLVIDSLEPIGHDLVALLAMLRYRLGRRLEAAGLEMEWQVDELPLLPWLEPPQALQVLRLLQELLANVLRHAQARHVRVGARTVADAVEVTVADDGVGFDPAAVTSGRGLRYLKDRAGYLQAELTLDSRAGQGTRALLRLPLAMDP
jgi:signal transduction histidine kinase